MRSKPSALVLAILELAFGIFVSDKRTCWSRNVDEAIVWLEKARSTSPTLGFPPRWLASAYALKGDLERAGVELAEARRLSWSGSPSSIAQVKGHEDRYFVAPTIHAQYETIYLAGLRKAGVPEE